VVPSYYTLRLRQLQLRYTHIYIALYIAYVLLALTWGIHADFADRAHAAPADAFATAKIIELDWLLDFIFNISSSTTQVCLLLLFSPTDSQ
jgi:hypothetical protein